MTEEARRPAPDGATEHDSPRFAEGRYLFCVVRPDDVTDASLSADGIDGREASLVRAGDLAAVTQPCESLYDASDPETVQRWLLRHQAVVDAAGEAFGTPIPFRFDTVIVGGDEDVRSWIERHTDRIHAALDDLAGRWEYRIEVAVEDEPVRETLEAEDDRLASLRRSIEEAEEGRAFLHEKQYEERLSDLRRARLDERAEELRRRVEPLAERIEWSERASTSAVEGAFDGSDTSPDGLVDGSTSSISLTVLATPRAADEIGEHLEVVAAEAGVEVRYSGPWPPYTFAPSIEADGDR